MTLLQFNEKLMFLGNVYGSVLYEEVTRGFFKRDCPYGLTQVEENARILSEDLSPDDMKEYGDRKLLWNGFLGKSVVVVSSGEEGE